jgi:hypothetical protein
MTANFGALPPPPPPRPRPGSTGPRPSGRPPRSIAPGCRLASVVLEAQGGGRQRSPPFAGAPQ